MNGNGKSGVIILAALCVIISVVTLFTVKGKDTTAPEIMIEKKAIYYDGVDTSTLLEGITAVDNKDGDVTDSLIVTHIYETGDGTGVVSYAAKDSSKNVATASRGFFYSGYDVEEIIGTEMAEDAANANESEDNDSAENADNAEETAAEQNQGETSENGGTPADDYESIKEQNLAQGIPFIKLVQSEATVEVGSTFNVFRYIEEAVDDKDSINTMLRIEGEVNTSVPGEYEVRVFAKDSDGNQSNVETLKVTVE